MTTIGDTVSRLRHVIKAVKEDAFITDRFLYSMVLKQAKMLIRRQDNENKIKMMSSLFETLPCVELEEVSKVEACCGGIKTDCRIMRTKNKLPKLMDGSYGPIIRAVSSVDESIFFSPTWPAVYVNMANGTNFKYNKTKYYWYAEGHLYFPNIDWDAVMVDALFEDSVGYLKCEAEEKCIPRQKELANIPDYLFAEVEQLVLRELGVMMQAPAETQDDKQSLIRP